MHAVEFPITMPDHRAPTPALPYAGLRLQRTTSLRAFDDWAQRCTDDARLTLLPVWRGRNLVVDTDTPRPRLRSAPDLHRHADELVLLGVDDETPVVAADLSSLSEERARELAGEARFMDLRRLGPALDRQEAALLSYARGMVHWHQTHRHCGRCGTATLSRRGGMQRSCPNTDCAASVFPRIDPAIIVLVDDGGLHADGVPRCLLGRAPGWPKGVYSTLAGFVEPGESLEEAVAREVREESDVQVEQVTYLASQPWPFPSSLMLGFHARARSLAITRHDQELEDARWFTADELRQAGSWGDDAELCLPRRDSIARHLIEQWLARLGRPHGDGAAG